MKNLFHFTGGFLVTFIAAVIAETVKTSAKDLDAYESFVLMVMGGVAALLLSF